jgi:hypothetical protein
MSLSDTAAEMSHHYWQSRTQEQRQAHARRARLGIVTRELGRHDLEPEFRDRVLLIMAPAGDLGPGECERCGAQSMQRWYARDLDEVCGACLGGVRR